MTLVTREGKGSELTWDELDDNFAHCLDRTNHTGTQPASTISDFNIAAGGVADAAVAAHEAALDPHPQYTTATEAAAAAPVQSVNGETGAVVLSATDVGADVAGAAAAAVGAHVAALDPHPQYLTQTEGDARYERGLTAGTNVTIDRTDPDNPVISAVGGGGGAVGSVNGQTGAVVLDTDDIAEGTTNLYHTPARAAAAAPVQSVNGQTGAVNLSGSYAPLSHVGAGGTAHATVVAGGDAGFMSGADKTKLDGIAAGAQVNVPTNLTTATSTTTLTVNSDTGTDATLPAATTSVAGVMTAADKTKLDGIASGATANATDAQLRDRSTHTGTQTASTISDFNSVARAQVEAELVAGTNVTITPSGSGATRQLTIAASSGASLAQVVEYTGTAKTLALTDINTVVDCTSASAVTITIPPQSSVTWTADAEIHVRMSGTGAVSIAVGSGVTTPPLAAPIALSGQGAMVTLKRRSSDVWAVVGSVVGGPDVVGPASAVDNEIARFDGATGKLLKAGLKYQTSVTDPTSGALALVGAFGLGTIGIATSDLDAVTLPGFYKAGASATGSPVGGLLGHNVYYQGDSNFGTMIAIGYDSGKQFVRVRQSGSWLEWKEVTRAGDYGIGGFAVDATGSGSDCDTLLTNGIYSISPATLNGPGHGGALFSMSRTFGSYNQIVVGVNAISFRTFATAWQPWRKVFFDAGTNLITADTGSTGFGTGSGGTVTQATSKATGVTLNKPSGQITMNAAALAADTAVSFTLTNSTIAANDVPKVVIKSGATAGAYVITVDAVAAGSCRISVRNMTAGSLSEALVLQFGIEKGAIA